MKCPICNADSSVKETRNHGTRRRRECFNGHRFTTIEVVVIADAERRGPGRRPNGDSVRQIDEQGWGYQFSPANPILKT